MWRFGAHLDGLEHVPEHRALLPLVRLGPVLVAVGGQRVQLVAQLVPVLELKILRGNNVGMRKRQLIFFPSPKQ